MYDLDGSPRMLRTFLSYMDTIKGKSKNTSKEYFYDLRTFFRFLKIHNGLVPKNAEFDKISIDDVTPEMVSSVTLDDLYEYMAFINRNRRNSASSRARKVSSLKSFYKYMVNKAGLIENNPAKELDSPKIGKSLPKYLDLESSIALLDSADSQNRRDYCMLTLLLNCGLRVSELTGINISDIRKNTLTVIGKGNKERTIYLNEACIKAINDYLEVRPRDGVKDRDALFLNKNKSRMGVRGVQLMVKKYLGLAGLDTAKYSTHKLRHTAATLMYKHGNVDVRALQEILGHENLSTTEIYTHVDDEGLREAVNKNPLSGIKSKN
ncbi:MAG: Tyrosine recombinase XerD [Firmicutes bacterium ADurb.Bin193]|nr:MAG: Tyrosine recombinase XerD [Firmicutes bacterium ADurb.Bin193]